MWGCVLGRFVGSFLLFRCLGKYELQVVKGSDCFFTEVAVQFFLRAAAMSCAAARTTLAAVTVDFEMYLCLKNNMPDILVALVILIHRRQQQ